MDPQVLRLLQALVRAGIPLNQLFGNLPGVGSALGAAGSGLGLAGAIQGGNVPGAVGSAAGLGANAANLAGYPGVAAGLGGVAGPLGLATALAQGNYGAAALAAPGAIAGGIGAAGAAGVAVPAALASAGALAASIAPIAAFFLPAVYDTQGDDFFDTLFGNGRDRLKETRDAPESFTRDLGLMAQGAGTLGQEGDLMELLKTAQAGINTRGAIGHNFDVLKNGTRYSKGQDMSQIESVMPQLSGKNWESWVQLMDRAAREGTDTSSITGHGPEWINEGHGTGEMFTDPATGTNTMNAPAGTPGYTTREASDLSQAIYGKLMEMGQGIDTPLPGARGAGGYLAPEQLGELGLTPGNYQQGILDYIKNMGSMGPAQVPPPMFTPPALDLSGGGGAP